MDLNRKPSMRRCPTGTTKEIFGDEEEEIPCINTISDTTKMIPNEERQRRLPLLKLFLEKMLVCDGIKFLQLNDEIKMLLKVKQHERISLGVPQSETLKKMNYIEKLLNEQLIENDESYEHVLKASYILRKVYRKYTVIELRFGEYRKVREIPCFLFITH